MKILHIHRSEPDEPTKTLIEILSEGEEAMVYNLYDEGADYERLIDLIFNHDKVVTWW